MSTISYPLEDKDKEVVRQMIESFGEIWWNSHYGPMHILISDYNALDHHLEFCRHLVRGMLKVGATQEEIDKAQDYDPDEHDATELRASLLFLDLLALVPQEWRDIHNVLVEDK